MEPTMPKTYPLDIQNVGDDTYIVMSKGHHDVHEFMRQVRADGFDWPLGMPKHGSVPRPVCERAVRRILRGRTRCIPPAPMRGRRITRDAMRRSLQPKEPATRDKLTDDARAMIMDACQSISRSADALKDCHTVDGD
ncbi:hypothetical protein WM11_25760 [Burkholderia ubonensis]|nr:hypothetical protein WI85_10925 [Burkholderia ubonensis]KVP46744.1 hypothetical protein WJ88_24130 [Burkholderia ubonensis]KVU67699.1 hypothetical protein WK71_16650 [Burkholderia ubonensis]KWI87529.1 hypothetical protein WM10_20685 [Burkholderia ubonensis]KWI96663.1 hypothetical protein WM11_25760 [Burkholderia ubonensis]